MAMKILPVLLLFNHAPPATSSSKTQTTAVGSITVGDIRVSAISPTLVRVEPKGNGGFFEDRNTFVLENGLTPYEME